VGKNVNYRTLVALTLAPNKVLVPISSRLFLYDKWIRYPLD
jgi:hypothetical protein